MLEVVHDACEKRVSGEAVINVVDHQPNTMAAIQQTRTRNRGLSGQMCVVVGLAGAVIFGLFFFGSIEYIDTKGSLMEEKGPLDRHRDGRGINSPPVNRASSTSSQNFWDEVLEQPLRTASSNGDQHVKLFKWKGKRGPIPTGTIKLSNGKSRNTFVANTKPIPIIDDNEDQVPQAVAGAIVHAADALMCRESVIDYVINATDLKDECDGLKRAYTKNCGGDSDDEEEAETKQRYLKTSMKNPVIQWQRWLHRKAQAFRRYWGQRAFLIEDEILDEWEGALHEVEKGWDSDPFEQDNDDDIASARRMAIRRRLNEAESFSKAEEQLDQPDNDLSETPDSETLLVEITNKTKGVAKEKTKLSNLALPTTKHHVSEKMLSETLLLQQEDKMMADVKAATSNVTAAAVADAAKSTKAVSDAYEYVSSVLNDPSSVEARTCCTSILNVFHEACSVDAEEEISDARLFIVVAVIALCGMVKSLIRHFQIRWLPEAAGCILVGVVSGWVLAFFPHHDLSFDGKWFLRILVPPIVFEAALSIDKRSFNRHFVPIMFYAVVGTLMSTGLTAWIVHQGSRYYQGYCETIPVVESLAFGSLISSIDPIAVLSVLSNMGMTNTDTIYVVIFGESLLNDGVAIVLYQTIVQFLDVNMEVDGDAVTAAAIHFLVVAVGSLLVGLGGGICCTIYYWAFHGCQTPLVEVLMFCCWALLPYYICDGIEWSGIVAVVAAGFVMDVQVIGPKTPRNDATESQKEKSTDGARRERRNHQRPIFSNEGHLSPEAKTHIGFVTEIIATMVETVIFAYLGLFLFSSRYHWNIYHTMIAIASCCVSRAIMIPFLSALANWVTKIQQVRNDCRYKHLPQQEKDPSAGNSRNAAGVIIDKKMQLVLWFAGLRGAMSFALIEDIPTYDTVTGEGTRLKSELKAMTSACIIFTVFVLGGLTYYMMDSLGMAPSHKKERQSNMEKELEMIGLLSGNGSFSNRSEDDDPDPANEMLTSQVMPQGPASSTSFRQRSPQLTL